MKTRFLWLSLLASSAALAGACSDDDVQPNPHFGTGGTSTGQAGDPAGGQNGYGLGGGEDQPPVGSGGIPPTSEGGMPSTPVENPSTAGSAEGGSAGMTTGGAPPEPPLYFSCVLQPKSHLDIINAPTDAEQVTKSPTLPALP